MKYNIECVREVLLLLEERLKITKENAAENNWKIEHSKLNIQEICSALPDFEFSDVIYSLEKLAEAGYIRMDIDEDFTPYSKAYTISAITFKGHEFLENIRSGENWSEVKRIAGKAGSFALSLLGEIAKTVVLGAMQK